MNLRLPIISSALLAALSLSSCETPGQSALAGAGTGAAIGGLLHGRGSDALAGAAIGAGAGYLLGVVADENRRDRQYDSPDYYHGRHSYSEGYPTGRRGFVESPYGDHNIIDVRGIPRGAKVVDPSTNRVFINP